MAERQAEAPKKKKKADGRESIGVFARLKPVTDGAERGEVSVRERFGKCKAVQMRNLEFSLDWIFKENASQEDVYSIAAHDRVTAVLAGFNATLIAYGQTGSGKTHTMFGPEEVLSNFEGCDPAAWGLVPRATEQLFEGLRHAPEDSTFLVQCSYVEVYNDRLNDLLADKANLILREKPGVGLSVEGMRFEMVGDSNDVMSALARGNTKRVVAAMSMNARSSRGHAIFTIYVKEMTALGGERQGKLNLVDLAGMESSKKSYAVEGASNNPMRREEAKNINVSLYALGSVISSLSMKGKSKSEPEHVPWRNAKLTRLLQDSLGGNSKSTIVVTLRTEAANIEESLQTLRFAQRAKAVKTIVKESLMNQSPAQLLKQIDELQSQLEVTQMLVRQLRHELDERNADDEARVSSIDSSAAEGGTDAAALAEEVRLWKKKHRALLGRSILHRILKGQSVAALEKMREESENQRIQLEESESLLRFRERENRELLSRVEMLEHLIHEHQLVPSADGSDGTLQRRGGRQSEMMSDEQLTEETILSAEAELQAAMASKDPERLKRAIANASEAVARARAKNSHVLKKANIIKGGDTATPSTPLRASIVKQVVREEEVTDEEKRYIEFHDLATQRKLNLASRGFEVQNIFIDDLYEEAADVPPSEWNEFILLQLPSPRGVDADGTIMWEGTEPKEVEEEETKMSPWKRRTLNPAKRKTTVMNYNVRESLIDKPDDIMEEYANPEEQGLSKPKRSSVLDAHIASLRLLDAPVEYGDSPRTNRSDASRGQRYSQAVRSRMEERQRSKGADHES